MPIRDPTPLLGAIVDECPLQAGTMAMVVRDLSLAVGWKRLHPLKLAGTKWAVLVGHKKLEDPLRAVLPLPLHTTALRPSELHAIFTALLEIDVAALPEALPPLAPSADELRAQFESTRIEETLRGEAAVKPAELGEEVPAMLLVEEVTGETGETVTAEEREKTADTDADEKGDEQNDAGEDGDKKEEEAEENMEFDPDTLYVAISAPDSTIVYYKIQRGIRKPHDIPDE